jgi:hypothetical protein
MCKRETISLSKRTLLTKLGVLILVNMRKIRILLRNVLFNRDICKLESIVSALI